MSEELRAEQLAVSPDTVDEPLAMDGRAAQGAHEFLGKGYEGWGYYADPRSVLKPLFDLSDLSVVEVQPAPSFDETLIYGESHSSYFSQLSANISLSGGYAGFSGEVSSAFSDDVLQVSHNVYATNKVVQAYQRLSLTDAAALLPAAAEAIASAEPELLFSTYGTHVLRSVLIGARVFFSSHVDSSTVTSNFQMSAALKASYLELVKGEASGGSVDKNDLSKVSGNRRIRVMGGDPARANAIMDSHGDAAAHYRQWAESVPHFVSIADFGRGGLVPIYELAATPERRAVLELAWGPYMQEHTNPLLLNDPVPPPAPVVVKKNARVVLRNADDRCITASESATRYYYAKIGNKPLTLQLDGGGRPLTHGSNLCIKTTEVWPGKWKPRTYLGAFKDARQLYYWSDYGSKTNWIVEKAQGGRDGDRIHYGEAVRIRNEHFSEQYLCADRNNYLTTDKVKNHVWVFEPST
ncbi:MAG: MAC/perforin domain-containing protein [Cyanobacteria bacterium J06638_7]